MSGDHAPEAAEPPEDAESPGAAEPPEDAESPGAAEPAVDRDRSVRLVVSGYVLCLWIVVIVGWRWRVTVSYIDWTAGALFLAGFTVWNRFNGLGWFSGDLVPTMGRHARALGWAVWPVWVVWALAVFGMVSTLSGSRPF